MPAQLDLFAPPPPPVRAPAPVPPRASARPPPPASEHVTGPELRRRGWTPAAVARFMGAPDAVVEGARGGWSYRVHHFAAGRVIAAEASPAFADWLQRRDARREAAQRGRARAVEEAATWSPELPRLDDVEVRRLAVASYNARQAHLAERDGEGRRGAAGDSEPAFLERISVNYLRHTCTPYDAQLRRLRAMGWRVEREAVPALKRRVLAVIAAAFPWLAAECERQAARVG